jgi:RNA polymerase sigma factor (sigma-70 family)
MSDDAALLHQYLATASPAAFSRLVERYVDLVYSAARRQVRDEHLAQDVTQATFILLSRRAASIRNPAAVGGWLLRTAHHVSCNALRLQRRRANHERRAAAMTPISVDARAATELEQIGGVLDHALAQLREPDRSAIVLRFMEHKSILDVGSAMGISEAAAQKRVTRALERLRSFFERRGIFTPADALSAAIAGQALHRAPAGFVKLIGPGSTGAGTASALAHTTVKSLFLAHVKAAVLGCAAVVALTAGVAIVASGAAPAAPSAAASPPAATQPTITPAAAELPGVQKFPNIVFLNGNMASSDYLVGTDSDVRRTPTSDPAGYIKSLVPNPKQGTRNYAADITSIRGKRVRLTAWVKTKNVDNWCGIEMCVYGMGQRVLAQCDMGANPISGTIDWKQYALVADVPEDAATVMFMAQVRGTGEMWSDDFQIETVGDDVPTTDDQKWHMWSPMASKCSAELDPLTLRDGHPTMRVTCNAKSWVAYDHNDRHVEQYLGKRVRVSAWLKADHVTVNSGLWIRVLGPNFQKIVDEGNWGKWTTPGTKPIKGTVGWTHFVAECDVPLGAQCIVSGMIHNGTGTMWMDDFKFEVVEGEGK